MLYTKLTIKMFIYTRYFYENDSTKINEKVNVLFTLVKMCASTKKIPYNHWLKI